MTEFRYRFERVRMTPFQRFVNWWDLVWNAVTTVPETHSSLFVEVKPDDPGYANAPFGGITDESPARFVWRDGGWVMEGDE
jgi:hypothetical protein